MCANYEDGFTYLKKDTNIKCWHGRDLFLQLTIGGTFILVWAILFPIIVYLRIIREKGQLDHPKNLKLYGIFYIGLNDDAFFWEIIIMNIRKIAIVVVATFFSSNKASFKVYLIV